LDADGDNVRAIVVSVWGVIRKRFHTKQLEKAQCGRFCVTN
jgi:hypothetical protein